MEYPPLKSTDEQCHLPVQNISFNKTPCFSQENTCVLVAQVGTRSRSSLLRVGSLVRGWFTSIICLLIGKKKKASRWCSRTYAWRSRPSKTQVCAPRGAGARMWGVGTGGDGAAAGVLTWSWLKARCCPLCLPLRLLSSQLRFQLLQHNAVSPCWVLAASGG